MPKNWKRHQAVKKYLVFALINIVSPPACPPIPPVGFLPTVRRKSAGGLSIPSFLIRVNAGIVGYKMTAYEQESMRKKTRGEDADS